MKRIIEFFRRALGFLSNLEEWTLVMLLLGLGILTFVHVVLRYVFSFAFHWSEEVNRYMGVLVAFMGASAGVKHGSHFAMELIFERLKNITAKRALRVVINLIGCAMFAIIAFYGWKQVMKLHMFGTLTSALKIPKYITYIPIPFFSAIMAVRFLGHSIGNFSDIIHRKPVKTVEAAS